MNRGTHWMKSCHLAHQLTLLKPLSLPYHESSFWRDLLYKFSTVPLNSNFIFTRSRSASTLYWINYKRYMMMMAICVCVCIIRQQLGWNLFASHLIPRAQALTPTFRNVTASRCNGKVSRDPRSYLDLKKYLKLFSATQFNVDKI